MVNNNLKKNFIWNIIGTTFSSFNSLFFMIVVTRINGIDDAGIFTFGFSTACLFYVIGIYSGRTYQVTDDDKYSSNDYFYFKIISCLLMLFVSLIFCFIRGYNIIKFIIIMELIIYKMLEAFSENTYAIMHKENQLYKVGQSMFLKAILSLLFFIIIDYLTKNLILSCFMIILFNLFPILFFDIFNLKKLNFKLNKIEYNKVLGLFKDGFYTFGFTFLTLYIINAPKYTIDTLLSSDYQTIFGIIIMPATILILFCQFIIQPFLIPLKKALKKDFKDFVKMTLKICICIFGVGLICLIPVYFLGIPILELLYGIDLSIYLNLLLIIIIGAIMYSISVILSTSLTTMRETLSQFVIFIIDAVFAFLSSNSLVSKYDIFGACYSYLFTMLLLLFLYIIVFVIKCKRRCS